MDRAMILASAAADGGVLGAKLCEVYAKLTWTAE